MRIKYIDIDFHKEEKSKHPRIDVSMLGCFDFSSLSCLVGVRGRTLPSKTKKKVKTKLRAAFQDDSGSKLRDKEQQRLSSK